MLATALASVCGFLPQGSYAHASPEDQQVSDARLALERAKTDLDFIERLTGPADRKWALSFTLYFQASRRLQASLSNELEQFASRLVPRTPSEEQLRSLTARQLLSRCQACGENAAAMRTAFEANPKSKGLHTVNVNVLWNGKPALGWRVGYIGYNEMPTSDTESGRNVDQLCQQGQRSPTLGFSQETSKREHPVVQIQVVVGTVFLWVRHPTSCLPRSEVQSWTDPSTLDLFAPAETP